MRTIFSPMMTTWYDGWDVARTDHIHTAINLKEAPTLKAFLLFPPSCPTPLHGTFNSGNDRTCGILCRPVSLLETLHFICHLTWPLTSNLTRRCSLCIPRHYEHRYCRELHRPSLRVLDNQYYSSAVNSRAFFFISVRCSSRRQR